MLPAPSLQSQDPNPANADFNLSVSFEYPLNYSMTNGNHVLLTLLMRGCDCPNLMMRRLREGWSLGEATLYQRRGIVCKWIDHMAQRNMHAIVPVFQYANGRCRIPAYRRISSSTGNKPFFLVSSMPANLLSVEIKRSASLARSNESSNKKGYVRYFANFVRASIASHSAPFSWSQSREWLQETAIHAAMITMMCSPNCSRWQRHEYIYGSGEHDWPPSLISNDGFNTFARIRLSVRNRR